MGNQSAIAVVIPPYRIASQIVDVIARVPREVRRMVVVDDASPDNLQEVLAKVSDPRLIVLRHDANRGVGGAVKAGFIQALELEADIIVKADSVSGDRFHERQPVRRSLIERSLEGLVS